MPAVRIRLQERTLLIATAEQRKLLLIFLSLELDASVSETIAAVDSLRWDRHLFFYSLEKKNKFNQTCNNIH